MFINILGILLAIFFIWLGLRSNKKSAYQSEKNDEETSEQELAKSQKKGVSL